MGAHGSLAKGFDPDYPWRTIGDGKQGKKGGADYYMSPAEAGGEPPGRWNGRGAEALGFRPGQEIERDPYDLLFKERLAPDGVTRLGRAPTTEERQAKIQEIYAGMLAAEPHATEDRKHELREEAAAQVRQAPLYFDLTISWSKSISIFHASLGENARQAREAGDAAAEVFWRGELEALDEMMHAAVAAGLDYFQAEAGYTRTGHHGSRVDGREAGKWQEADLAVASFLQHTSRDGDPQMHVHNLVAHIARTCADGKWRAPDSRGYHEYVQPTAQKAALHLESAMTRRFGVAWEPREDGYGAEIAGISGELMRECSSRRETILGERAKLAENWERHTGQKPTQWQLARLGQQANLLTREGKEGPLDLDALRAGWSARLRERHGVELRDIARRVSNLGGGGAPAQPRDADPALSPEAAARAAARGLAAAQAKCATWTRADLIAQIGRALPAEARHLEPGETGRLLEELADQVLAGSAEPVVCLEAPQFPAVPEARIRADGRSVYQRHGGVKYATQAQLSMEERLVQEAQAEGAPCVSREEAARMLGADAGELERALREKAQDASRVLPCGLRLDQAAALFAALTSPRNAEVLVGPAGSGKTRTLAEAARIWSSRGFAVVGVTPSQASRNVLAAAMGGRGEVYNFAQFLGHLPGRDHALGIKPIAPGTLIIIDEGSMLSTHDKEAIIAYAAAMGAKVLAAGDFEQLEAVEDGGGLALLAARNGYVQLAKVVRMDAEWEREASLRLRAGDVSVLSEYEQHGRIRGGDLETILEDARQRYVARVLAGKDALLMARSHELCREVSRRIRDDLQHLGIVERGREVTLNEGARASVGDLIICRDNDSSVEVEPGRTLANKDTLRIDAITDDGQMVVRLLVDCDRETGERRYGSAFLYGECENFDLAYAVTGHGALGRTVTSGSAIITGSEPRQWAYVALTRGTAENYAGVCTEEPRLADPQPGARPAPELARAQRLERARRGEPEQAPRATNKQGVPPREGIAVMADVLRRDGAAVSALEVQRRNLANADHLAMLRAQWEGEALPAQAGRYERMLREALPEQYAGDELSHCAGWLWRTLQSAEAAGLDPAETLRAAIDARPLEGARDIAAVLDARIRERAGGLVPQTGRSWADRVPECADQERQAYLAALASAMDDRTERLGEFIAEERPAWALRAFGSVPEDPLDRLEWEKRAAPVAAYREMYGYDSPGDPIGAEPPATDPDRRGAWHAALAGLGPAEGEDLRGETDGTLLNMAAMYPRETAWAPRYVADELRQVRVAAEDAERNAIRADAEARVARERGDEELAGRHEILARSGKAAALFYRARSEEFAATMEARAEWEEGTEHTRRLAVAADSEYRQRHPDTDLPPLRSAEPEPPSEEERQAMLTPPQNDAEHEVPQWVTDLAERNRAAREKLEAWRGMRVPNAEEDPDLEDEGEAWPALVARERDAILQPPKPEIKPSAGVVAMAERETAAAAREASE